MVIKIKDLGWTRFWHGWARIVLTILCDCVRNDGQIQHQLNFVSWLNVIDQQIPSNVLKIAVQLLKNIIKKRQLFLKKKPVGCQYKP
jgi:hypothetical protein